MTYAVYIKIVFINWTATKASNKSTPISLLNRSEKFETLENYMNGVVIEQVTKQKYLGVMLDPQLSFSQQTDYAVGKAKRAAAKISGLYVYDGRDGIPVQTEVHLYKKLVRPHLEYAIPMWVAVGVGDKDMNKLQQIQVQCLKRMIGAKSHSSSTAIEVITEVVPCPLGYVSENCVVASFLG